MGNKHELAPEVAEIVASFDDDAPFLDLFCGMCSIGSAIAPSGRPVWGNDVQWAASTVARCLLATQDDPPTPTLARAALTKAFDRNSAALRGRFATDVASENAILESNDVDGFVALHEAWSHAGNDPEIAAEMAELRRARTAPYRLFTLSFAWGYFGLVQAIEIDSIRYAIDRARTRGELTVGQARWALVALMQAASCLSSSPGHFAQYLRASTLGSFKRVRSQRRRGIWDQFFTELTSLRPLGSSDWRSGNTVMRRDALTLWPELRRRGYANGVIYSDPPYSKDHYSRYYHVLETLVRYDYPQSFGQGRYRPDRFVTPFSLKTRVEESFLRLARGAAGTGSALILSYPSNGLLSLTNQPDIEAVLSRLYRSVELAVSRPTTHSTLGARHGGPSNLVDELIFVARDPRSPR